MKKKNIFVIILFHLLLIGIFLPLNIQAADAIQETQYLGDAVLCMDIEEKEPVLATTSFHVWDEKAVCWVSFNYQSLDPFAITWEWISPEEEIYHIGEIEMEAGDYGGYRTWYWIGIEDHYAANLPGDWEVRVYIDDILLAVKDFTIR